MMISWIISVKKLFVYLDIGLVCKNLEVKERDNENIY